MRDAHLPETVDGFALREILEKKSRIVEDQTDALRAKIVAEDKLVTERIAEIAELVELGLDRARHVPGVLGAGLQHIPLATHARYRREEILAALGYASLRRVPANHVAGVAWSEETRTDAFLVNLRKSEKDFSPSTMYRDYAISPELFHWESQNSTSTTSLTGLRYLHHREQGSHIVLFVRESPTDDLGAAPFLCLGQASYVEHRGERPIAITWKLHRPMPAEVFVTASVVAG
jgi:hypothetical protein